jgi:hypothetical protein
MHQIAKRQNENRCLQLLAAARHLYANAKQLLGLRLALGGPVATILAAVGIAAPGTKPIVALSGLTILALDLVWLTPREKHLREAAARIQERFDCDVLGLSWDTTKVGNPERPELVHEQATRYRRIASAKTPLADWYPRIVDRLPLRLARLVCQRANCEWDGKQRRMYARVIAALLLAAFVGVFLTGVAAHLSAEDLLLAVISPMSSTLRLCYQQWVDHRDAANRLDVLRERAERIWKDALRDPGKPSVESDCRSLQSEIFDGRKRNPLVFEFVFKRLRARHEAQMRFAAKHFVEEAEAALLRRPTSR